MGKLYELFVACGGVPRVSLGDDTPPAQVAIPVAAKISAVSGTVPQPQPPAVAKQPAREATAASPWAAAVATVNANRKATNEDRAGSRDLPASPTKAAVWSTVVADLNARTGRGVVNPASGDG